MKAQPSFFCYCNGVFLPLHEISLNPYDLGLLRGYAVFDVMSVENGKPFLLEEHWQRLVRSAETLCLMLPVTLQEYQDIIMELIAKNGGSDAPAISIRTVLSGGVAEDAYTPRVGQETFLILIEAAHKLPPSMYALGVKLLPLEYARQFSWAKVANHIASIRTLAEKREAGALEALYVSNGMVLEAATSNVALVRDGGIVVPADGVLAGITLEKVLALAAALHIPIERRTVTVAEFLQADEVFLTASNKRVVPVTRIGDTTIKDGKPGKVTRQLMAAFDEFVKQY